MIVVLCNCPIDHAESLAATLVEERLAACVNIIQPVKSVYRWEGEIVTDAEATLLIKTSAAQGEALRRAIEKQHPYSVPEILALPVDPTLSGDRYVAWVRSETEGA